MKKETFVKLIKVLEDYKNKSIKFGKAVADAYVDAGAERDFVTSTSYEFPYGKMMDEIVKAISLDFANNTYKAEFAEDFINWWLWECDFGKKTGVEYESGKPVRKPMAEVTFGDKTYVIKTPGQLYDVILKHAKFMFNKVIYGK